MLRYFFVFLLMLGVSTTCDREIYAAIEKPVFIGGTVSLEGDQQEPSTMAQKAYLFWLQEVNAKGGLLGRPVKLITYNDKSDPELAGKFYRKLIEEDQVDLLLAPFSTPLTLAASAITEQYQKLMLASAASATTPWRMGKQYLIQTTVPATRQFIGMLDLMARHNLIRLAVLYNNTSAFCVDSFAGIKEWADTFNIEIIFQQAYQDGIKELPELLKTIQAKQVDGLINVSYSPESHALLRLLETMQYRPKVLCIPVAPVDPGFLKKAGPFGNRVFSPSHWEPDERVFFPGSTKFIQDFVAFTGHMPSYHAASMYGACILLEQAIAATGSLDDTVLRDHIVRQDTMTPYGRFKVDNAGAQVGYNSMLIQWQNGQKEIVWPQKLQTAEPLFK